MWEDKSREWWGGARGLYIGSPDEGNYCSTRAPNTV